MNSARGYTLIEMLVSTAIIVVVVAAIAAIVVPSHAAFLTQPDAADMEQRLRVAVGALTSDVMMAGAGTYQGAIRRPLGARTATILPRRIGLLRPDPEATAATDRISIVYVPATASQTTLRDALTSAAGPIVVDDVPGCPRTQSACGLSESMPMVVFDDTGAADAFTITDVQGAAVQVRHQGAALTKTYGAGASAAEAVVVTYWFDRVNARLMKYDGDRSDLPLVDDVVALRFEYFGEPRPPRLVAPASAGGAWTTTYGAPPPDEEVDDPADSWGAGENCLIQVDAATAARIPRLADLNGAGDLVPLTSAALSDGPWCPDGVMPNRFDADLLRIRLVRVRLRVQATRAVLRGPAGPLFARGGSARAAGRLLPDREVEFDVAPRNLNLGR